MRRWLVGLIVVALLAAAGVWAAPRLAGRLAPIRVGLLHSRTGPMKISELSMIDAEVLALEEINAAGGLLGGRRVEWVIADGESDWPTFAREAERLIRDEKVSVIFGCWTSASRKSVKPVIEQYHHLLFYPMAYEGLEESPNIVYTGAAPNQQVVPAIKWSYDRLEARKYFLTGSDYIWPHAVNAIARDYIEALGAEVVGEEYVAYGSTSADALVESIRKARPDVVISTVVGDTNLPFYRKLTEVGLGSKEVPVISLSIAEAELRHLPVRDMVGDYAAWNYFQTIDSDANRAFVARFKEKYGADSVTSDVIMAAYNSVWLWAQAVAEAESDEVDAVIKSVRRQSRRRRRGSSRSIRRPSTPGGRSTSARSAATASSRSSGRRRRPSARSRSRPPGRRRCGKASSRICTGTWRGWSAPVENTGSGTSKSGRPRSRSRPLPEPAGSASKPLETAKPEPKPEPEPKAEPKPTPESKKPEPAPALPPPRSDPTPKSAAARRGRFAPYHPTVVGRRDVRPPR